jgi:hypothetical protein
LRSQRLFKIFFLSVLCELCGELFCGSAVRYSLFPDETGKWERLPAAIVLIYTAIQKVAAGFHAKPDDPSILIIKGGPYPRPVPSQQSISDPTKGY